MSGHVGMDAHLHELERKSRRRAAPVPPMLPLFDVPETVQDELNSSVPPEQKLRVEQVHDSLASSARHWIDLGKPIAVAVAKAHGTVTAEMFRDEASKRGKLRPETEDRSLSYLATMFRELVKEGHLKVARHPNGDPVKKYSKVMGNDQNVYLPVPGR